MTSGNAIAILNVPDAFYDILDDLTYRYQSDDPRCLESHSGALFGTESKEDHEQEEDDDPLEPRSLVDDPVPELVNLDQLVLVLELPEIPLELLVLDGPHRIGIGDLDL